MTEHDESYDPRPKTDELVGVMHAMWEQCIDDIEGRKCGEGEVKGGYGDAIHVDVARMEIKRLDTPSKVQRVEAPLQKGRSRFRRRCGEDGSSDGESDGKVGEHFVAM